RAGIHREVRAVIAVPENADLLSPYLEELERVNPIRMRGEVTEVVGLLVESRGPAAPVGSFCEIETANGVIPAQVVGFRNGKLLSIPMDDIAGLRLGDEIVARDTQTRVAVGSALLGRVIDGFGKPLDGAGPIDAREYYDLQGEYAGPMERPHIEKQLVTGIRAIDGMLACGEGQRIGLFGGSGVGKSTLLGAMARQNSADVTVIALIGERNREVRGFLEHELGPEGLAKSVIVVATSDRPAPLRIRASLVALTVAEYFRDQGKSVLLVMDSVTRLAMAQREIGLAAGEPPSQKGYTPSVFSLLPRIFERAGRFERGSITGFFTVLVEGDDMNEPIADAVRGILDGHLVLSRDLGAAGHYPAIDVLQSVSRVMPHVVTREHMEKARRVREALAEYRRSEDLIRLGAYVAGTSPKLDAGVRAHDEMMRFLRQDRDEKSPLDATLRELEKVSGLLA
ncbi:MAG TPA: FliI/YscN family ATPase, partial [Bryobacteraceae bacterium]|nr:FliI/YscN family ATPase [Bryobacteraceae bacterium]